MDLRGKIIDFLGDSITEGIRVEDRENNRFDNIIKREFGLKEVHNYGIGGTRLAHQSHASEKPRHDLCFCGRTYDLSGEADIIVVYGGVNDYFHGDAPIGKIGDETPATYCGAVEFLMRFLTETYKNARIVFLTPARYARDDNDYRYASKSPKKLPDAQPLVFYRDVIRKLAPKYDIPVLDMYEKVPLDLLDVEVRKKYTADGLHFNDEGHKVLAKVIADFLLSL
ncbi:MAG: SGNH/GDSL hydrolase family protein [Clostridiales bacterium]|nr:SGNH/GDSL hydrolase family protein [Clostridiales bacterium]